MLKDLVEFCCEGHIHAFGGLQRERFIQVAETELKGKKCDR